MPPFVKGIRNVVKALDLALGNQVTPEAVTTLGPKQTSDGRKHVPGLDRRGWPAPVGLPELWIGDPR